MDQEKIVFNNLVIAFYGVKKTVETYPHSIHALNKTIEAYINSSLPYEWQYGYNNEENMGTITHNGRIICNYFFEESFILPIFKNPKTKQAKHLIHNQNIFLKGLKGSWINDPEFENIKHLLKISYHA